jgi:acyl-CoA synthetase (AMP-forming)/AMP-acid ligase II
MLFAVPTMFHRIAEAAAHDETLRQALRRARLLVSGSAGLSLREHERIQTLTGRGVHERYGLTETLINCAVPASSAPMPGYVGPPLPGVELKLVDEERRALDAYDDATIGEIAIQSDAVFAGYLNRDDATAEVLDEEGWFYTGDLATRARDGSIRILGRRSNRGLLARAPVGSRSSGRWYRRRRFGSADCGVRGPATGREPRLRLAGALRRRAPQPAQEAARRSLPFGITAQRDGQGSEEASSRLGAELLS